MKLEAEKILNGFEAIEELTNLDESLNLDDAYLILDTMDAIKPVFDKINKLLGKIEMKFVPKDDNGNMILGEDKSYIPTNPSKRMEEITELKTKKFDVNIKLFDIRAMGITKISPKLLKKISFIIKR